MKWYHENSTCCAFVRTDYLKLCKFLVKVFLCISKHNLSAVFWTPLIDHKYEAIWQKCTLFESRKSPRCTLFVTRYSSRNLCGPASVVLLRGPDQCIRKGWAPTERLIANVMCPPPPTSRPPKNNWRSRLSAYPCSNTGYRSTFTPNSRKQKKSKCFFQQRNSSHRLTIREVKCPVILPGQMTMTMKKKMGKWSIFIDFCFQFFSCWTFSKINYAKLITSLIW